MPVPPQRELHRPLLEIAYETGDTLHKMQFVDAVATRLALAPQDLSERLPSGQQTRILNRVDWGLYNLMKAGLLHRPFRGCYQITTRGKDYLHTHTGSITNAQLSELEFELRFAGRYHPYDYSDTLTEPPSNESDFPASANPIFDNPGYDDTPPQDKIDAGYNELKGQLSDDLLDSIASIVPEAFERLVVDLLEKMGYGKGQAVGRSGDGGIDGVINQDSLGLEKVYIQAKRWQNQVGEPEIRNFSGSLDAKGASKGVFVTTSNFSSSARRTAETISAGNKFIRLIDGPELAKLMLDHDVGVITTYTYKIQALDENYFADEL